MGDGPTDRVTANLPSRDFDHTAEFYTGLGFETVWRGEAWMVLRRGPFELEFFAHPELIPATSWFSACIRTGDLDGLFADFAKSGLSDNPHDIPRLMPPVEEGPIRYAALVDPDGNLIRCIDETFRPES